MDERTAGQLDRWSHRAVLHGTGDTQCVVKVYALPASLQASFGETLYGPLEMQFLPLSFLSYFCGLYGVCQIEGHNSQFN